MGEEFMITLTKEATEKISDIIAENNDPSIKLRMFIQGGGCAGFSYGFTLDAEQNDDDFVIPAGSTSVLVDSMSMQYLNGAEVHYKEELLGSSFVINNPNSSTTCGCGSSFSV